MSAAFCRILPWLLCAGAPTVALSRHSPRPALHDLLVSAHKVNDHLVTEQTMGNGRWQVGQWLKPGADPRYQTGPTALSSAACGLLGPVTLLSVARLSGRELLR